MSESSYGRRLLLTVFVASGFTGLIYESIWSHYLQLFLGHAAYSQALVLAIFMGGMALGSGLVAHYSTRIRQLLWGYVLVEGLIGVCGIVFHPTFVAATHFSFATAIPALPGPAAIHAFKWTLAALLILPQSVLLGMTFPLISAGLIRRWPARPGETLATLYFANSLGAAFGVLGSGFVLIPAVGLPGTVLGAGLLNVVLALLVWTVVRRLTAETPAPNATAVTEAATRTLGAWITTAAFLTGAASFMYELGWIRMLSMVLGSSTHSFELMLSAFIFGLAFGGLYVRRRIEGVEDLARYLGWIMLVMGGFAALTIVGYRSMFDFMAWALTAFARTGSGYTAFNIVSQAIAALVMVPATFCAGMTLPLLTRALMRAGVGERAIGRVYALNTVGAIAGVLLTIHVLLPALGVKGVILTGAAIHAALGLSRLLAAGGGRTRMTAVAAATAAALLLLLTSATKLDPLRMASGVYRTGFATLPAGATVSFLKDGKTATISLAEQGGLVVIATNGKTDASIRMGAGASSQDEVTTVLAAAIPLSLCPNARRVANIGFGSGLTSHALLAGGNVSRLDSVEIEPVMVEAARLGFGERISDLFRDSRSHIVIEDAKTFFATRRAEYDLIVSEPSNPWVSGVATLFSDEFYAHLTQHLQPNGCFAQWLQIYETDIGIVASIVKALAPHFGAYAIYNADDANILIIATRASALAAEDAQIFSWPALRADLDRIGVTSLADIRNRRIGDERTIGPLLGRIPVPANSDFFPFVDLNAPRLRYMQRTAVELAKLTILPFPYTELLSGAALREPTLMPSAASALARDGLVRRALAVRDAVTANRFEGLDSVATLPLLVADTSRERCTSPMTREAWKLSLRRISDMTAAFLNASELEGIWAKIRASACYGAASGSTRAWADVLAAVARRDAATIAAVGTTLLDDPALTSADERGYLAVVIGAADIGVGRPTDARAVLEREWNRTGHPSEYDFPLLDMLALTRSSSTDRFPALSP